MYDTHELILTRVSLFLCAVRLFVLPFSKTESFGVAQSDAGLCAADGVVPAPPRLLQAVRRR